MKDNPREMTQSIAMVLVYHRIIFWTETAIVPRLAHHLDLLKEYLGLLPISKAKLLTLTVHQTPFQCFLDDTILEGVVTSIHGFHPLQPDVVFEVHR